MEKINYNGLSCLATPVGAAMLADILHSSVAYTSVCAYMYGLVCSAIELRVSIPSLFHVSNAKIMSEKNEGSNKMPILGALIRREATMIAAPNSHY